MPFLPSIEREDKVPHVLAKFNSKYGTRVERPLIDFHQALLRGDSPFTVKERELMAAYVSGVNACRYCHGAHASVAKLFGVPEVLIRDLVADVQTAPVEEKLRPVFAYLSKLTLTPTRMTQADAEAVYAAGWDERALYDAVLICWVTAQKAILCSSKNSISCRNCKSDLERRSIFTTTTASILPCRVSSISRCRAGRSTVPPETAASS